MAKFNLKGFWRCLDDVEKARFAKTCGVSVAYITTQLVYARKMPKPSTINGIVKACAEFGKTVDREQVAGWFLAGVERQRELRRRRAVPNREVAAAG